jgi:hypothetical protein
MSLTRDEFLSLPNDKIMQVLLPDNLTICVREMSGLDRERFELACYNRSESDDLYSGRALLTIFCACNADGSLLFTEDDLDAVSRKPAALLDAIYRAAIELNVLGQDRVLALAKNSEIATDGDLPTD